MEQGKLEERWIDGLWLGKRRDSNEHLLATKEGVTAGRTVKRLDRDQFNVADLYRQIQWAEPEPATSVAVPDVAGATAVAAKPTVQEVPATRRASSSATSTRPWEPVGGTEGYSACERGAMGRQHTTQCKARRRVWLETREAASTEQSSKVAAGAAKRMKTGNSTATATGTTTRRIPTTTKTASSTAGPIEVKPVEMEVEPEQRGREEETQRNRVGECERKRPRSPSPPEDPMTLEDAEQEIQRGLRRACEADELEEAEGELRGRLRTSMDYLTFDEVALRQAQNVLRWTGYPSEKPSESPRPDWGSFSKNQRYAAAGRNRAEEPQRLPDLSRQSQVLAAQAENRAERPQRFPESDAQDVRPVNRARQPQNCHSTSRTRLCGQMAATRTPWQLSARTARPGSRSTRVRDYLESKFAPA